MTTWQEVLGLARISIEELKGRLPLQYVLNQAGVALEVQGGRLAGLCPFHADTSPSFAVFGDDLDVCGCWSCEFQHGDHFDFLQRFYGLEFVDAVSKGLELLGAYEGDSDWEPLKAEFETVVQPETFLGVMREAYTAADQDPSAIQAFLLDKDLGIEWGWLHTQWWVGVETDTTIVIPHFDHNKVVTGYKTRYMGSHPYAVAGSKFPALYGAWRDAGRRRVIVCEGESDTWWVSWVFRDEDVDVVGLPTGVGTPCRADWQEYLAGRDVTIFFDGDGAGRGGSRRWAKALEKTVERLRVVVLSDNVDAALLSASDVKAAVRAAVVIRGWAHAIRPDVGGYRRTSSGVLLSDWIFTPHKYLDLGKNGFGFEGTVNGRRGTITSSEFGANSKAAKAWSHMHEGHWFGTEKDTEHVLKWLSMERPFLPEGKGTYQVGWHEGNFVTVRENIGPGDWTYIEGDVSGEFDSFITMHRRPEGVPRDIIIALLGMHQSWIIKPIIAWMMAALMRDEYYEFPILCVVGASGAGKTTILDTVLTSFGFGGGEVNLTSTTRYGISMMVAGSTGVPVWIDEVRRGGRKDARESLEQTIRDGWTKSRSLRGGMGTNLSRVHSTVASAPLIVSGEDMFSETSLVERIVMLRVPADEGWRGSLAARDLGHMGLAVVRWLTDGGGTMPVLVSNNRPALCAEILEHGWGMFQQFALLHGVIVGELEKAPEWSMGEGEEIKDPVLDLLIWGLQETDRSFRPLAWEGERGSIYVRTRELLKAGEDLDFDIPGGERSTANWLVEWAGGGSRVRSQNGRALKLPPGSIEKLDLSDIELTS